MKYLKKYNEDIDFDDWDDEEENFNKIDLSNIFKLGSGGSYYIKQDDNHIFNNYKFNLKSYNTQKSNDISNIKYVVVYDIDDKLFPDISCPRDYANGWKNIPIKELEKLNLNESIDWDDFDYDEDDDDQFIDFPEYLSNKDAIGKKVKIKPGTRHYNRNNICNWRPPFQDTTNNPTDTIGIIKYLKNNDDYGYVFKVLWDNGQENSYARSDLIIQI